MVNLLAWGAKPACKGHMYVLVLIRLWQSYLTKKTPFNHRSATGLFPEGGDCLSFLFQLLADLFILSSL